jgi:hypothetical protein
MKKFTDIQKTTEGSGKKIVLNFRQFRRGLIITGIFCIILFLMLLNSKGNIVIMNQLKDASDPGVKLQGALIIAAFFLLAFLLTYPIRIIIKNNSNGTMTIEKRDLFFSSHEYKINNPKESVLHLTKNKLRFTLKSYYFFLSLKYLESGENKEIDLVPKVIYYQRMPGILTKEEGEEISKYLNLKLEVEEN